LKLIFRVAIYFSFVILITFLHFYKVIPSTTDLYLNIGSAIEPVKECFQGGCVKKVPEVGALKALSSYSGILILFYLKIFLLGLAIFFVNHWSTNILFTEHKRYFRFTESIFSHEKYFLYIRNVLLLMGLLLPTFFFMTILEILIFETIVWGLLFLINSFLKSKISSDIDELFFDFDLSQFSSKISGVLSHVGWLMIYVLFATVLVSIFFSNLIGTLPDILLGDTVAAVFIFVFFILLLSILPLFLQIFLIYGLFLMGVGIEIVIISIFVGPLMSYFDFQFLTKRFLKNYGSLLKIGSAVSIGIFVGLMSLGVMKIYPEINPIIIPDDEGQIELSGYFSKAMTAANSASDEESNQQIYPSVFVDVTQDSGTTFIHHEPDRELMMIGGGIVIFDYDNNGFNDIYVVDSNGPNSLFRNNGDNTFTDVATLAGVDDPEESGNGGCAADYDNDSDVDLYVTNYGMSKFYSNKGDGFFEDVTKKSNLAESRFGYRSTGCAWGDYDNDGLLDLVVVRHLNEWNPMLLQEKSFLDAVGILALFHNNGDGTFSNTTYLLGDVNALPQSKGIQFGELFGSGFQPAWFDYDNDGDLDLYIVNDMGEDIQPNVMWRNDGLGSDGQVVFKDVSVETRTNVAMFGMGIAVGDYDLDGYLDMFLTNIYNNVLFKNIGDGTFLNVSSVAGTELGLIGRQLRVAWGTVFFDYDNDGKEDLYMVSGYLKGVPNPVNPDKQKNVLLRNQSNGTFLDVSNGSGVEDDGWGRGVSFFDFDKDGCLDLYLTNFNNHSKLFQGLCEIQNNWITIKLIGNISNRDAVGARIELEVGGEKMIREVTAGSSSMGQNMIEVHFGLGEFNKIDGLKIKWPSGIVQYLNDLQINQYLVIEEQSN